MFPSSPGGIWPRSSGRALASPRSWTTTSTRLRWASGCSAPAGAGFGAGIVLDGRLVRGASGFGGELGHAPVRFDGPRCWCGGRGCLALYASGRGIVDSARARVAGHPQAPLLEAARGDPMMITAPGVFHAAAEGDS